MVLLNVKGRMGHALSLGNDLLDGDIAICKAIAVISWSRIRVKRRENRIRGKLANSLAAKWQGPTKNYFIQKHS